MDPVYKDHFEASESKWVNSDYIQYGVNSLSLWDLCLLWGLTANCYKFMVKRNQNIFNKLILFSFHWSLSGYKDKESGSKGGLY